MDVSALSSGSPPSQANPRPASKKPSDEIGLNRALNQGAIVSGLLPALSSGSSGSHGSAGLSADIYTAVGMQTQGMMSRGLMGIQIANISLGIDMSQAAKAAAAAEEAKAADEMPADADSEADAPGTADAADGADAATSTRYYSNPELSNPALGGLLNSLG